MEELPRQSGRPRDETTAPALLEVTRRLINRDGYEQVSISTIIKEAGVSRQSLYRRWPTKADLVLDAFFQACPPDILEEVGEDTSETMASLLQRFLTSIFLRISNDGTSLPNLIASAQNDPHFRPTFIEKFVLPRQEMVTRLLACAVERGELPADSDVDTLTMMINGAFWYRVLNGWTLDATFASKLVRQIFHIA